MTYLVWAAVFAMFVVVLLGYFLGCLNGSVLVSHFIIRDDVRQHGSGNAGLTNFYRTYGAKYALGVILLDMGKTVAACLIGGVILNYLAGDWTLGVLLGGLGSELGHMVIVADGEPCTCGNHGCWERYTSATAMIRMGREAAAKYPDSAILTACGGNLDKLTAKMVMDAAKAGDPAGVEVFKKYVHYLAVGIVSIINILDPEVIAIGGGVSAAGEFLRDAVRAEVDTMIFCKEVPYARIEIAVLGNDAGIIGAAMLGK